MSRLTDAIMPSNTAWAKGRQNAILDLKYGGMMGFAPDLTQWVSNQAYVRNHLICLLIEAPTGFQLLDNPERWVGTLRTLVENHALSIEGLNAGLEIEVQDTSPVGGSGEMHQDFTNVTRARSNPVFRWTEKYGKPITSFLRGWVTYLMMDPDSKVADVATLGAATRPTDMLADRYAATMLFIEPDVLHNKVVHAWLCTNMWPTSTGEVEGRRDLTQAKEPVTYSITFTAITQFGAGVDVFAQTMLDSISITGANPSLRPAFQQAIAADILASNVGYKVGVDTLANSAIKV